MMGWVVLALWVTVMAMGAVMLQGFIRRGGLDKRRSPTFSRVAVKRELRNDEQLAFDVEKGKIHLVRLVFENSQI